MDYQKHIVRAMMEGAGEHTGVQLEFLLQRLEACPEALPAIADAMEDMGLWQEQQANALRAEMARRAARDKLAEIVNLQK